MSGLIVGILILCGALGVIIWKLVQFILRNQKYWIIVDLNQPNVTEEELDKILADISIRYNRKELYISGQFRQWYSKHKCPYFFMFGDKYFSQDICNDIRKHDISAFFIKKNTKNEMSLYNCKTTIQFKNTSKIEKIDNKSESKFGIVDNFYYVVISNIQTWLDKEELDQSLLEISKNYRESIYSIGELENAYALGVEYCFIFEETYDKYSSYNLLDEVIVKFREKNVNAILKIGNEINKNIQLDERNIYLKDDEIIECHSESIESDYISSNKKYEIDLSQILSFEKIQNYDSFFSEKIIGQEVPIQKIKQQLITKLYEVNNNEDSRPAGIFFFVGPTGVGKTELCKQLSEFLYNNKEINRLDMSEYKDDVAISKIIGAPNWLVGYEEGGVLTNKLNKNPNAIILFDEIEKAHNSVFDLFLQMFDEGYITSNKGEKYNLKNSFIVLTSNIGVSNISPNHNYEEIVKIINEQVYNFFTFELNRPEILGRIGKENIIVFNTINKKADQYKILDIYFNQFNNNFKTHNINISYIKNDVYNNILNKVDVTKGARDIRNEFDEFKKHFNLALFENKIQLDQIQNKTISFEYIKNQVYLNLIN